MFIYKKIDQRQAKYMYPKNLNSTDQEKESTIMHGIGLYMYYHVSFFLIIHLPLHYIRV